MTPYKFTETNAKAELERVRADAARWKPTGYNEQAALRLAYYTDRQREFLIPELTKRFPKTSADLVPTTIPLVKFFVNETAKVFLEDTKLPLAEGDKEIGEDDPRAKWWNSVQQDAGLDLALKMVDRYTNLFRTAFLKPQSVDGELTFDVYLPQHVDVVWDPTRPFDLDAAFGVLLEIGTDDGLNPSLVKGPEGKDAGPLRRFEFWCAREGSEQYVVVDTEGALTPTGVTGYPFKRENGRAIVPLVMFTAHTRERGAFVLDGEGVIGANLNVNVIATELHHMAAANGFGQLVIETDALSAEAGRGSSATMITGGPSRAINLPPGQTAKMLSGSPDIAAQIQRLDTEIKRTAMLNGIPPGAVSLEARAVASGIALQIEMRPLLELRRDAISVYRRPMRRTWAVTRAVHAAAKGEPAIGEKVSMRWRPGEVQMPVDPRAELDAVVFEIQNDLCTRAEGIARLRRIPLAEAEKLAEEIAAENRAERAGLRDDQRNAGADAIDKAAAAAEPDAPPDPGAPATDPAAAAAAGVVQDTALNGSQLASLLELVTAAAKKEIPVESIRAMISLAFPTAPQDLVNGILAPLAKFKAPEPPPAPAPFGGKPAAKPAPDGDGQDPEDDPQDLGEPPKA